MEKHWQEFKLLPFPRELAGKTIAGVNPERVEQLAADCIRSFLEGGRTLDARHREILVKCMTDLRKLNPILDGDAQVYFGKLYRLCDLVYAQL